MNCSVLFVDDDINDLIYYKDILHEQENFSFLQATSFFEALDIANRCALDCVILDYNMPDSSGEENIKKLKSLYPDLPVVVLTGQGSEPIAVNAMKAGADDYLMKSSIDSFFLSESIKKIVEISRIKQTIKNQERKIKVFSKALSHDLTEPVKKLRMYASILAENGLTNDEKIKVKEGVDEVSLALDDLFKSIRVYISGSENKIDYSPSDKLGNIVGRVLSLFEQDHFKLSLNDRDLYIPTLNGGLSHILINLLRNSIQFQRDDVELEVEFTVEKTADDFKFVFKDNGIGIAKENLKSIFEPFFRGGATEDYHSGLGLSVCREILNSVNGDIKVISELGKGATFHFSMPSSLTVEKIEDKKSKEIEKIEKILWVDDDAHMPKLAKLMLKKEIKNGLKLDFASDGNEALAKLEKEKDFNLVFIDINMPNMNGLQFLEKLRESKIRKDFHVVMCSSSSSQDDIYESRNLGADGYVTKPFSPDIIKGVIDGERSYFFKK